LIMGISVQTRTITTSFLLVSSMAFAPSKIMTTTAPGKGSLRQPFTNFMRFREPSTTAIGMRSLWHLPEAIPLLPSLVPLVVEKVQTNGENIFAAALMVSMIQAAIALGAYRTNPKGELIVPPGLTIGVEDASQPDIEDREEKNVPTTLHQSDRLEYPSSSTSNTAASAIAVLSQPSKLTSDLGGAAGKRIQTVARCLVLLLPWVADHISFLLERHGNIIHAAFLFVLTSLYDFGKKFIPAPAEESPVTPCAQTYIDKKIQNVVVIGDSMACGIGCIDKFDTNKNSTVPMMRLETLSVPSYANNSIEGPAFPQAFARTLSERLNHKVHWRSAGVDGGDINDIRKFCLGVIKEETQAGRTPDVVVVLCGTNDLKKTISNPLQLRSNSARAFRDRLSMFIRDIRDASSKETTVILPALPTHKVDKRHALNLVPLTFFLDIALGAWDSQKKLVADAYGRTLCFGKKKQEEQNIQSLRTPPAVYLGLSASEVNDWYKDDANKDHTNNNGVDSIGTEHTVHRKDPVTLISADGLHPNQRCYSLWGSSMANKYVDEVLLPLKDEGTKANSI